MIEDQQALRGDVGAFERYCLNILMYQLTEILLLLASFDIISFIIPILQSIIIDIFNIIVRVTITLKHCEPADRTQQQLRITIDVYYCLMKLTFVILQQADIEMSVILPGLLLTYVFLNFVQFFASKSDDECVSSVNIILLFFKVLMSVFLIQVILKYEESHLLSGWSWSDIFWPYWMIAAIQSILIVPGLYLSICKSYQQYAIGEQSSTEQQQDFYGLLWIMMLMIGLNVFMYLFGLAVIQYASYENEDLFWYCLVVTALYSLLGWLYTFYYQQTLRHFIYAFSYEQPQQQNSAQEPENTMHSAHRFKNSKRVFTRVTQLSIPQFFVRRSTTYYAEAATTNQNKTQPTNMEQTTKLYSKNICIDDPITKHAISPQDPLEQIKLPSSKDEVKDQDEIKSESSQCICCFEREVSCIFMPCKHGGMCYTCAITMWKQLEYCHICRKKIESIVELDQHTPQNSYYKAIAVTLLHNRQRSAHNT